MQSLLAPPEPFYLNEMEHRLAEWRERAAATEGELGEWMRKAAQDGSADMPLLQAVFGHSSYLSRLLARHPDMLQAFTAKGADACLAALLAECAAFSPEDADALVQPLRQLKGRAALLVALADMSGAWALEQVTAALSAFAEAALSRAVDTLLAVAHKRGEIVLPDAAQPSRHSGLIVLGMGKLGGRELNYSSDIDLVIFYEPGRLSYQGRQNEQHFMNKLTTDLVKLMQERTKEGYVFRTDLRLRPDPASTPPAITIGAAYYYYESVGQNWERAAMIKARAVAGDMAAGERFLKNIAPFMWRRSLDFAAINDIHSIKRQMDTLGNSSISIPGHHIKLGKGGIREIEFYAQIHQLIWGGREKVLRSRATCETIARLCEYGLVEEKDKDLLLAAYAFYRKLEHRLQMVADEQTHSMPETAEGVAQIARFMGFADTESFAAALMDYLTRVHALYSSSFKSEAGELGDMGNLVFTGTVHDPDTIETLRKMGYSQPGTVSEIVMGWHHGARRATRTKRARELLTELMPILLKRLSETANPDAAFLRFDDFLRNLPSGVQLFSLFSANPDLLGLISDIMGSAPTLADSLSRTPELLDSVLYADFYSSLPSPAYLSRQLEDMLQSFDNFEDRMDCLRRFRNEKQFQAGVQLLKGMTGHERTGQFLSHLADAAVQKALDVVEEEFAQTYGRIEGARFAVLSLGRLGSREITFGSDIDLVFVYDAADAEALSDGEKPFAASVYYNRLAQRFLNALTALGRDGRLYEVDTRLRPSGKQGLLAVSLEAFRHYFTDMAWTFEYMALTKARAGIGEPSLRQELERFVLEVLSRPREPTQLSADIRDMRERIDKEHGTPNPWDIKYVRGGLIDMDFMAQYQLLLHGGQAAAPCTGSAAEVFGWLAAQGLMPAGQAAEMKEQITFMSNIFNMLRLCTERKYDMADAPQGLKKLLVEAVGEKDFESLTARLIQVEQSVLAQYIAML